MMTRTFFGMEGRLNAVFREVALGSLLNLRQLLLEAKSIAVVGAKDKAGAPVDDVTRYLLRAGYRILPVHPARKKAWGLDVYPNLAAMPFVPDFICLFRSAANCLLDAEEVLALQQRPKVFWMQAGIFNAEVIALLEAAGIAVIQDQCLKTAHQSIFQRTADQVFACRQCGHCCYGSGGIVLSEDDLTRLRLYVGLSEEDFRERHCLINNGKLTLNTGADNYCVFFEAGKGCAVHQARPDICRAWPYFRGNLVDKGSMNMIRPDCPGISDLVRHPEFAWSGYYFLLANNLLGNDLRTQGRALLVEAAELPDKSLLLERV